MSIDNLLKILYYNISFVEECFIVDKYDILLLPYSIYVISINITLQGVFCLYSLLSY